MSNLKKKTIVVVLDGFDYEYVNEHLEDLQYLKLLKKEDKFASLSSVVPADSIPSWTSIYTGLNPAEHGVIESIDYLNFKNKVQGDYAVIKGKSFWDTLSKNGKKVLIFNPFMAYPSWDVNGLMICGPVFEGGELSTNKPEKVDIGQIPPLGGLVDHPTNKTMNSFISENIELTQKQFNAFHDCFQKDEYDFRVSRDIDVRQITTFFVEVY